MLIDAVANIPHNLYAATVGALVEIHVKLLNREPELCSILGPEYFKAFVDVIDRVPKGRR
jgi:hypothetical protein